MYILRGTIGQVKKPVIIESFCFMTPQEKKMCHSQENVIFRNWVIEARMMSLLDSATCDYVQAGK